MDSVLDDKRPSVTPIFRSQGGGQTDDEDARYGSRQLTNAVRLIHYGARMPKQLTGFGSDNDTFVLGRHEGFEAPYRYRNTGFRPPRPPTTLSIGPLRASGMPANEVGNR